MKERDSWDEALNAEGSADVQDSGSNSRLRLIGGHSPLSDVEQQLYDIKQKRPLQLKGVRRLCC